MIKKLRIKFVFTAALAVFITLGVLVTAMNVVNSIKTAGYADDILRVLYQNGGKFEDLSGGSTGGGTPSAPPSGEDASDKTPPDLPPKGMNEETPYETRFFSVKSTESGLVVDVKSVAAISESRAIEYYLAVKDGKKTHGYAGNYRYLVADDGNFVIFVDCTRGLNTAANFLKTSIIVSAAGLAAVVLLLILFSKKAIQPVKESYERQKRFITDASHELKTPLTIISANNELIALLNGESKQTETIEKQVERMTATVKDLTELSRLDESEGTVCHRTLFSLEEAVSDSCCAFEASLRSGGRTLEKELMPGVFVFADEAAVRRCISTVLDNARKYALTQTKVTLKTVNKYAVLTIANDAEGIREGNLGKCFERFYRSDEARASGLSGSGIGLSIAKSVIERTGGEISAYGEAGEPDGIFKIEIKLKLAKKKE